jgi:hypothetical protein
LRATAAWREVLEPLTHRIEKATCVALVLEAGHQIVGITHDDHVALGFPPSPAFGPKVEDVVEVDVGEERRNGSSDAKDNLQCCVGWRPCARPSDPHQEPWAEGCSAG